MGEYSPWFPPSIVPVRDGVYECKTEIFKDGGWFRLWNGNWNMGDTDPDYAKQLADHRLDEYIDEWRGLARNPKRKSR